MNELLRIEYDFYQEILPMYITTSDNRLNDELLDRAFRAFHAKYGQHITQYEIVNDVELLTFIELDAPAVVVTIKEYK